MRIMRTTGRWGLVLMGAMLMTAAGGAQLAALGGVKPGLWQLHEVGSDATPRSLCVSDTAMLLQLRHPRAQCSRFVLDDQPHEVTVHYTCPGAGNGRTTLRIESDSIIHVATQGLAENAPFDLDYEGRRLGDCPALSHSLPRSGQNARVF